MKKIIVLGLWLWIHTSQASQFRPIVCILVGPSGVGKSTLVKEFLQKYSNPMRPLVTSTTRVSRQGEIHGQDYHFISHEEFKQLQQHGGILLPAEIYGNWYGIKRSLIVDAFEQQHNLIACLTFKVAQELSKILSKDAHVVSVGILPPDLHELQHRLQKRNTETTASLHQRLTNAPTEIAQAHRCDTFLVNHKIPDAATQLYRILYGSDTQAQTSDFNSQNTLK